MELYFAKIHSYHGLQGSFSKDTDHNKGLLVGEAAVGVAEEAVVVRLRLVLGMTRARQYPKAGFQKFSARAGHMNNRLSVSRLWIAGFGRIKTGYRRQRQFRSHKLSPAHRKGH